MNILIYIQSFIPSVIIGQLRPLAQLERQNKKIKLRLRHTKFSLFMNKDINWCDVAVFCRHCELQDLSILYELKRKGKKIIYEIDDNFEEIELNDDIGIYHRSFHRLHVMRRFFEISDVTRVYSDILAKRAIFFGAKVQKILGYFDKSILQKVKQNSKNSIIKIAYPANRIDNEEIKELLSLTIKAVLKRHPEKVQFHFWGSILPKQLSEQSGIILNKTISNYENFIRSFYKLGFDIGLAPIINNNFFKSKTNNKYREFAGCGIAGIYSNITPYSESVIHESTGLLVKNTIEDWVSAIDRLILDDQLRNKIKNNAIKDVHNKYSFKMSVESWQKCLNDVQFKEDKKINWLPKKNQIIILSICKKKKTLDDYRYQFIFKAVLAIKWFVLLEIFYFEEYVRSENNKLETVFFLIDTKKDLLDFLDAIKFLKSAIIDLSLYKDDLVDAANLIKIKTHKIPISILISSNFKNLLELFSKITENTIQICNIDFNSINQNFSLNGYPSAYLDLMERHIKYSSLIKKNYLQNYLQTQIKKLLNYFILFKRRLKTIAKLIAFKLGFRNF
jgi:glycosyltransferase involved in cell wall biosynthesis